MIKINLDLDKDTTHHALIKLVDKITKSLDNGDIVIGVLIDLKTVDHKILFKKLYYYGIRGNALKWFESYLTNRSQYVLFNGEKYSGYNIRCTTRIHYWPVIIPTQYK